MPESQYKPSKQFERTVKSMMVSLYPRDYELLQDLSTYLGCSRSEAIRTAIRSMVAQLGVNKK